MRTKNSQLLLALLALLTMVFSIGFFIGRQSIPYEVAAQTEHAVKQTDEFPAQEKRTNRTLRIQRHRTSRKRKKRRSRRLRIRWTSTARRSRS